MNYCIPGELWNQVEVPTYGQTPVLMETYIAEIAYKLPSVTDVMMAKEMWHAICEFAERTGALREAKSAVDNLTSSNHEVAVGTPTYGAFQRFVGAKMGGTPVGFDKFSTAMTIDGIVGVFDNGSDTATGEIFFSVVPDIGAPPENQKAPRWFLSKYEKVLMHGTMLRLFSMDGKPWTNGTQAQMNATAYMAELNRVTHGLITSGMRRQILVGMETALSTRRTQAPAAVPVAE